MGDVTRDGRDDVVLGRRKTGDLLSVVVLRATSASTFAQSTWWSSTTFNWTGTRLATADVNRDGRADLILYRNGGTDGTLVYRLTSTGLAFHAAWWRTLYDVSWRTLEAL